MMMMWFGARSLGASMFPVPVCGTFHSSARSVAYHYTKTFMEQFWMKMHVDLWTSEDMNCLRISEFEV